MVNGNKPREDQSHDQSRQRKQVRKQLPLGIDKHEPGNQERKNAVLERAGGKTEPPETREKQESGEQFNRGIARRNWRLAFPASTAEDEPTQNRNIVISLDLLMALGAGRRREHHRFPARDTVNANVQEAAEDQPEQKYRDCEKWIQRSPLIVTSCCDVIIRTSVGLENNSGSTIPANPRRRKNQLEKVVTVYFGNTVRQRIAADGTEFHVRMTEIPDSGGTATAVRQSNATATSRQ